MSPKILMKQDKDFSVRTKNDYNIFAKIRQWLFIYSFLIPVCKTYYGIHVEGRENLPSTRKLIYAGNHQSYIDPPFVSCAVLRPIAYMAKRELFDPKCAYRIFVEHLGAFAVDREKPKLATFKTVKEIFKTDWGLGIFPEGGISDDKILNKVQRGMAVIAKHAQADVIPIAISDWNGYPKISEPFKKHVKVTIGKPISYKLSEEEISMKWCEHISKYAGYKIEINEVTHC